MQIVDPRVLKEKYLSTSVKIDPFFLSRTSLLANQTLLKLGEYNLIGAPAFLSMEEISVLVVLSPGEVTLFSKFTHQMSTLILSFSSPDTTDPVRFHLRVVLSIIKPLPNRKNVSLMVLKIKSCPTEIVTLLGSYIEQLEAQKESYEKQADDFITISPEESKLLGYNDFAEIIQGTDKKKVFLKKLSSKKACLHIPGGITADPDSTLNLKLYFRPFQFSTHLTQLEPIPDAVDHFQGILGFSGELMSILDDYKFKVTMSKRKDNS